MRRVRLSTGLPGARAVWQGCSSDGRFAGAGHSLLWRRGGEYSSLASGTARMRNGTSTRGSRAGDRPEVGRAVLIRLNVPGIWLGSRG
jgi:hypothetical protein